MSRNKDRDDVHISTQSTVRFVRVRVVGPYVLRRLIEFYGNFTAREKFLSLSTAYLILICIQLPVSRVNDTAANRFHLVCSKQATLRKWQFRHCAPFVAVKQEPVFVKHDARVRASTAPSPACAKANRVFDYLLLHKTKLRHVRGGSLKLTPATRSLPCMCVTHASEQKAR